MPQIIAAVGAAMTAVGVAIGKALTAFGVGAYTAGVVGGMAVKFGVQVAIVWATSKLLAPKLDNVGARQADVLELSLGEHPREAIFGRAATGGTLIDAFNWGGSQNDWEAMVIALADHECHALVGFYVDDKYVAFAGDGNVSGYSDSNGAALQVFFLPGTSAQTLPATVGAGPNAMSFVSASGGRWTADDRLLGVAAVIVCYRFTPEILGGRPVFRWVVDGKKCYDPRLDSTVTGGSGAHRWDNPATHAWTDNAAICRYNYLRGVYVNSQLILGPGRSAEEAPPADVIGPANVCDETVALLAGGTVKRYTVSAVVRADEPWIDVEEAFAAAMGAELIERSGMIVIEPGASKAVAKTFVDADLLSDFPVEVQAKLSRRDLVNTVSATYVDPSQMYEEQTAPIRRASEDISADGEVRDRPLALRFVTSGNQAQRLGEIERRKARLQRTANVTLGPRFSVLEVGDWVTWQGSIYNPGATAQEIVSRSGAVIVSRSGADIVSSIDTSGANRTYMVVSAAVDDAQRITLGLREIASNVYAWTAAIDELDPNQPAFVAPTPPAGWSTGSNNVLWSDIFGANRPSDNATQNRVYSQPSEPTGVVDGDIWHDTDANPPITYYRVGGVWATGPNLATNTNQLTDGAALGQTANWPQVTGAGRPADNATVGARAGANLRNFADTVTLGDADVITSQGTAADFSGRGALATLNTAAWGSHISGRPTELTDGRVSAGLDASGDVARNFTESRLNSSNVLRRSTGGLYTGDLAATVGARAGTNLYRTDGTTVMTQAEVRTAEGTAADFSGRQWGATATEGQARNAARGNSDNVIPDPDVRDNEFWNFPAGFSGVDTDGGWLQKRVIKITASGSFDVYSDYFPVELGETYIIRARIWNNLGGWAGAFWPLIHMPWVAWYSLKHGGGVVPTIANSSNAIVAQGDTGNLTWVFRNPTGVTNNANREWQFRFLGSGIPAGQDIYVAVLITRASRLGGLVVREDGSTVVSDAAAITSLGTAADFVGRGPWATVTTPVADVLAPNPNLFPFPSPIQGGVWGGSTPAPSSYGWLGNTLDVGYWQPAGGDLYIRQRLSGGAAVTEYYYFDVPNAVAGQQYTVSLNGYVTGGTFGPYAECLNASKTILSGHTMSVDAASSRWRITFTAVANTAFIRVVISASFNATGSYQDVVFNRIKVEHGSQMTPLASLAPIIPRQSGADVTGSNTAADFSGRGALATLNAVDLAGGTATGDLASSRVRNSGTALSDRWPAEAGANVTETRTAADFSGRGALATANFYRQSSDPGAVADGSLWTDTSVTPNLLKQRISGAWQTIATANTTPTQLTATASPKSRVKTRSGAGSATTDTVTVTAAGGTSPYTYAWSQLSGKSATATASTSATTAFQYTVGVGEENETSWECVVTDAASNVASALVRAVFVETS